MFSMFLFSFVSATVNDLGTFPKGDCVEIKQVCASCTYVNLTVSYPNSTRAVTNIGMNDIGSATWTYDFCQTNVSGRYDITGEGDILGTATGFDALYFNINEGGMANSTSNTNSILFLLAILVIFFIGSLTLLFKLENYIAKFTFYWISHVLFILITFTAWQIGVEGILGSVALTGIFRILFYVSTIAVLPMVILSGAWIFYIHTFNEHFQKLVNKGMDTESAFKIANKKSGGWINGQ